MKTGTEDEKLFKSIAQQVHQGYHTDHPDILFWDCPKTVCRAVAERLEGTAEDNRGPIEHKRRFQGTDNTYGAAMMADRAYRDGVEDIQNSEDSGIDRWADTPYFDAYNRGGRNELRRRKPRCELCGEPLGAHATHGCP